MPASKNAPPLNSRTCISLQSSSLNANGLFRRAPRRVPPYIAAERPLRSRRHSQPRRHTASCRRVISSVFAALVAGFPRPRAVRCHVALPLPCAALCRECRDSKRERYPPPVESLEPAKIHDHDRAREVAAPQQSACTVGRLQLQRESDESLRIKQTESHPSTSTSLELLEYTPRSLSRSTLRL